MGLEMKISSAERHATLIYAKANYIKLHEAIHDQNIL